MEEVETQQDSSFETLLDYLQTTRGFDFRGYKRSTLTRRIARRMQDVGAESFESYRDYLVANPTEIAQLFDTILINVTSFFRDQEAWEYVARQVVPQIVANGGPGEQIRVWSVGCASGEEPYTIAMLLAEHMGLESFARRVKIYATDLDEAALAQARRARYSARDLEKVPEGLRNKYFQPDEKDFGFHPSLRRAVIFGRHDLLEDSPIPHLDLLICRNTLMYFTVETQSLILSRFHFALKDSGFIFLGRAEMLLTHSHLFVPVDLKHRIFTPVSTGRPRVVVPVPPALIQVAGTEQGRHERALVTVAFQTAPVAQIVLDQKTRLALFNKRASVLLGLTPQDLNRLLQDLELSYRPIDLRSMVDQVRESLSPTTRTGVERSISPNEVQFLEISVSPLMRDGVLIGFSITFGDITDHQQVQTNLQRFAENLETAYEELQSANEELETTNEELQSANEELETTNEELQAANEEMETMNEELRCTNDDLTTTNERLRAHEAELHHMNLFLHTVLENLQVAVVVVGSDLRVLMWKGQAMEMWGLRSDEVEGQPLMSLDIGLPVADLVEPVRAVLQKRIERSKRILLHAVNRRGRPITCRVLISALAGDTSVGQKVLLLMEEWKREEEE